jgi:hypothetical protein
MYLNIEEEKMAAYIETCLYLCISVSINMLPFQTENESPGDFAQSIYCLLIVQI